jgi:hypothetical protein
MMRDPLSLFGLQGSRDVPERVTGRQEVRSGGGLDVAALLARTETKPLDIQCNPSGMVDAESCREAGTGRHTP